MATVGSLRILLTANAGGFNKGMRDAGGGLTALVSQVESAKGKLAGILGALGVGLSVAGFAHWIHSAAESVDATGKLADRLGMTTESLIGLRYAAHLAGVSAEDFGGMIEKMEKKLGEAAIAGGPAADALKRLGLDARKVAGETPDKAFKDIAEAVKGIANPYERAAAATEIFGKSGMALINTLMMGRSGLEKMQERAEMLGITFSRVDAAKVEEANDRLADVGLMVEGLGQKFAVDLSPYIEAAANKMIALGASANMGQAVSAGVERAAMGVAALADAAELVKAGFYGLRGALASALLGVIQPLEVVTKAVEWLYNKLTKSNSHEAGAFFEGMAASLEEQARDGFKKAGESYDNFKKGLNSKAVATTFADINVAADAAAKAAANSAPKFKEMGDAVLKAGEDAAALTEKLREQIATYGQSSDQAAIYKLAVAGAGAETLKTAQALADFHDTLDRIAKTKNGADALAAYRDEAKKLQEQFAAGKISAPDLAAKQQGLRGALSKSADAMTQIDGSNAVQYLQSWETNLSRLKDGLEANGLSVDQFREHVDALNDSLNTKLEDRAKQIREAIQTPTEKLHQQADELKELFARGFLNSGDLFKATKQLQEQFDTSPAQQVVIPSATVEVNAAAAAEQFKLQLADQSDAAHKKLLETLLKSIDRRLQNASVIKTGSST